MLRRVAVLLGFLWAPLASWAQSPPGIEPLILPEPPARIAPRPLASALDAMRDGRWDVARALAARDGPAASLMVEWYWLLAGFGSLREVMDFTAAHPDWPARDDLRKQVEAQIDKADPSDILEFFRIEPPQTGTGILAHAAALMDAGQQGEAEASVVLAWRSFDLSSKEHHAFLAAYEPLLKPHHAARLDMAWWRGLRDVQQMLPLVSDDMRALIAARQLAKAGASGLDKAIAALPAPMRDDAGIAYGQFNRLVKSDSDAAIALILKQSKLENGLGQPEKWASWRRALARAQMREGKAGLAYELASMHQLVEGSSYSDLEWLSGYIALTYFKEPELALDHFQRFRAAVGSPISLGRAGYWIGRAQEALGDTEAAQLAYAEGARHQTSFYGLLAAERAGLPFDPELAGKERFASIKEGPLARSSAVEAMVLSLAMGDRNKAERFVRHMAATLPRAQLGQLAGLLEEMGAAHLQVMLGKGAAQRGIVLHGAYYPLHPLAEMRLPVPAELALAIARRESEFDPDVVSGAGAQGLMQVMPGTASDVARALRLEHEAPRLLADWQYNATLGSEYLARMTELFDGNIIMISAAYNAGPARPPRWMEAFGDPRTDIADETNIVDWIEHIPFRETRNYVMRVSESLPIYRARLGKEALPQPFSRELTGRSIGPRPAAPGE